MPDPILPVRRKVEKLFADALRTKLATSFPSLTVVPGRADAALKPPYVTVLIEVLEQLMPDDPVYRVGEEHPAKIALVNDINDAASEAHDQQLAALEAAISEVSQTLEDDDAQVRLYGFKVIRMMQAPTEQTFGDVFDLVMGVSG